MSTPRLRVARTKLERTDDLMVLDRAKLNVNPSASSAQRLEMDSVAS
jgi:hypothetical protein